MIDLKKYIETHPDFPKPGILFYDISSLMADSKIWQETINQFSSLVKKYNPEVLAGIESRGFIFASTIAYKLGCNVIMIRKKGKLPGRTIAHTYQLEYGEDTLEIHKDAIKPGDKVLLVDDLLATGGTIEATVKLVEKLGGKASDAAFVISLPELGGEEKMQSLGINILKLVEFEGE